MRNEEEEKNERRGPAFYPMRTLCDSLVHIHIVSDDVKVISGGEIIGGTPALGMG
jgi:hypothetical protein